MNNSKPRASDGAEQAIQQVLQAERDAERAIENCEKDARQLIHEAQVRAQRINARADERITNMEMRHGHKLDQLVRSIEREGAVELRLDAGQQVDPAKLQAVIDALAAELCQGHADSQD